MHLMNHSSAHAQRLHGGTLIYRYFAQAQMKTTEYLYFAFAQMRPVVFLLCTFAEECR
jgi:hypothetical protein